jgi:hypothetical protein
MGMRVHIGVAVVVSVLVAALCGCGGSAPVAGSSASASPATQAASPAPVDLTLPTTIYAGSSTIGAELSAPSSPAKVSARRALRLNHLAPKGRLTGTVLADVTMPGASYDGGPLKDVTSWVYVYTFTKPFDPRIGGMKTASPSPSPSPLLVQHAVFILNAADGDFVRGFFVK